MGKTTTPQKILKVQTTTWSAFMLFMILLLGLPTLLIAKNVAILTSAESRAYAKAVQAFIAHLPPSLHIALENNLRGNMTRGRNLARHISGSDVQAVLAVGLKAALAARFEIKDIPVIFCLVLFPNKHGLPTDNMVGLSLDIPFQEQIKSLQTLVPSASRLGVLYNPENTGAMMKRIQEKAQSFGLTFVSQEVKSDQEVVRTLDVLLSNDIDALWLLPDRTVLTENSLDYLMSKTLENNIPVAGFSRELVKRGALVATHVNYSEIGQHAATVTMNLLQNHQNTLLGTLIHPNTFHRSLNQKTAESLGLSLSPELLMKFDERL